MIMTAGIFAVAVIGAESTFSLIHRFKMSTIRASCLATLVFCGLLSLIPADFKVMPLQAAFFGATFVGMTDKSRMGAKRVLIASLLFALIYIFLIPLARGFGGGLGAAAFVSCAIIYSLSRYVFKKH